jgi:hypothetical protein
MSRADERVSNLGGVAACENRGENVEKAVACGDEEDDVEEQGLPALREDAQEEEAEGDFEGGGGEDVEDFAELDVLHG